MSPCRCRVALFHPGGRTSTHSTGIESQFCLQGLLFVREGSFSKTGPLAKKIPSINCLPEYLILSFIKISFLEKIKVMKEENRALKAEISALKKIGSVWMSDMRSKPPHSLKNMVKKGRMAWWSFQPKNKFNHN